MEETINKTIVVTYDDISRMKDFCTNKEEGVTKEFMDWYVNDNAFFSKTGILICDKVINSSTKKFVISFDFNDPDMPRFVMYDYHRQKPVCRYTFSREDNLDMKDIVVKITWVDLPYFHQPDNIFLSDEAYQDVHKDYDATDKYKPLKDYSKMSQQELLKEKKALKNKIHNIKAQEKALQKKIDRIWYKIALFMAQQGVYFTYATMYYFAKNKAKEVTAAGKNQEVISEGKKVKALYKYTGYVNVNEAKVYVPVIKKEGPVREYGRHIEKWSVRGHYRKVGDKKIWIESFEKGEGGDLEKRIYGTEKESEVNLIPKVFEVTRTVRDTEKPEIYDLVDNSGNLDHRVITLLKDKQDNWQNPPAAVNHIEIYRFKKEKLDDTQPPAMPSVKKSFWSRIVSFFTNLSK